MSNCLNQFFWMCGNSNTFYIMIHYWSIVISSNSTYIATNREIDIDININIGRDYTTPEHRVFLSNIATTSFTNPSNSCR